MNPTNPHCRVKGDFLTTIKFLGSYLVPRVDVQLSASWRNEPGFERQADFTACRSTSDARRHVAGLRGGRDH